MVHLKLPKEVETGKYYIKIEVEGRDELGNLQEDVKYIDLYMNGDETIYIIHKQDPEAKFLASKDEASVSFTGAAVKDSKSSVKTWFYIFLIIVIVITLVLLIVYFFALKLL